MVFPPCTVWFVAVRRMSPSAICSFWVASALEGYIPSGFPRPGPMGTDCFPSGVVLMNGNISHLLSSSLLSAGVSARP